MYNYVIAIKIKNNSYIKINNILKKLKNTLGVKYYFEKSSGPHITLTSSFKIKKDKNITKLFLELKKIRSKPFDLKFKNISIFFEKSPFYVIRWKHNKEIILLKNEIEKILTEAQKKRLIKNFKLKLDFISKSTIAHQDTNINNLKSISKLLKNSNFPKYCLVDNISLYRFILNKEEESIFEIKLNSKL